MIDILLVEDHRELAQLIVSFLKRDGFQVHHVESGEAALSYLAQTEVRLLLLDIMLPHMDGFTVCKKVREHKAVPILIMSARKDRNDQLNGYELGADDYIEKPVDPQILAAKIRAVLQRTSDLHRNETISCCGVVIERAQHRAFVDGNLMELNAKEFELLTLLVSNAGKTLRKEYIFASIWGMDSFSEQQTLTVHIKMLRDKIEKNPKQPQRIKTVWGVGYRFEEV